VTPIRRQYLSIKESYLDAILLFRLGDFYETFDKDARIASQELEIVLTSRSMGKGLKVPMAGFPVHALDTYLTRLIHRGHKVAICEQTSDPNLSKGLVEREVVRFVTPGTVLEPSLLEQKVNNYLAAVVEEDGWAGLAYVDITTGEFATTQMRTGQLILELDRISPSEVLVPRKDIQLESREEIGHVVDWHEPGENPAYILTFVDPYHCELKITRSVLLAHYGVLSLESYGCSEMPLAVRAAGVIVGYVERTQKKGAPRLAALNTYSSEKFMVLDPQSRRNLELFQAGRWESNHLSLLSTLDLTCTAGGGRMLRRWLGQPLLELGQLNQRLDAVGFFYDDAMLRSKARDVLARVPDLERIMRRVLTGSVNPRELISLSLGVQAAELLLGILGGDGKVPFAWPMGKLIPLPEIVTLIDEAVAPEPTGDVGQGNVIRQGFSPELDKLRQESGNARRYIAGLEQKERLRTGIKNLKVGFNHVFGYYLEISNANLLQVPPDYIRRQTLRNGERYVLPELKEFELIVLSVRERTEKIEKELYRQICAEISKFAADIVRLSQTFAQIDVFVCFAEVAVLNGYVRPRLDRGDSIIIKEGRHPVVERVLDPGSYVPNDAYLSSDHAPILLVTGANMSGKSTFIRQVALITLMAQLGSFVPAAEATIGLVDRIFTRMGLQDDLTTGQSTFMVEMVETAAILNQATPKSLVILDEIGRGTSTYDGFSIARSVIEHLHNDARLGCRTLFATHYHELAELVDTLPGIRNFSVAVEEKHDGSVVFLHRIVPGAAVKSYGVHVAQLAGLPLSVVRRAKNILESLEGGRDLGFEPGVSLNGSEAQLSLLGSPQHLLLEYLISLDISNLTPLEAINKLYELQRNAQGIDDLK
jgi:DNA mismatch repair protein MutS